MPRLRPHVLFSLGAIALTFVGRSMPALAFLLVVIAVFFTLRLANIELLASMTVVAQGVRVPRKSFILTAAHPMLDVFLVSMTYFLVYFLAPKQAQDTYNYRAFLVLVVPYFLVLIFSGVYKTYWLRAGIERYYFLSKLLLLSAILSFILLNILGKKHWVFDGVPARASFVVFLMQTTISWSLILGERFILRYFEAFALRSYYLKNTPEAKHHSALIYGGGLGCRMYLTDLYTGRHLSCPFRILGIVDDDLSLRKLNVYGFRVLGTSHDLEAIYRKKPFETLVLTSLNMTDEAIGIVSSFAKAHDVKLTMFVAQEYPADREFFQTLQAKAIYPLEAERPDEEEQEPGLGL